VGISSIICNSVLIIYISIIVLLVVERIHKLVLTVIERKYSFKETIIDLDSFIMNIVCKLILEKMLHSQTDANGNKLALRDISTLSEPFFQGMVVNVIGNMSDELKRRFYMYYKEYNDNSTLITKVSNTIEIYSIELVSRIKVYEDECQKSNKIAVEQNTKLVNSGEYIFGKLIYSITLDIANINKMQLEA